MSNVFNEIEDLKTTKLASDMGASFTATVLAASKHTREDGRVNLKLELQTPDGATFTTTYRIPKARTGKGQLDILLQHVEKLGLKLNEIVGKTFEWKQIDLPGSVKGNPRHYPVKIVGQKKLK